MIDYETFCKIRDYHTQRGLKVAQIAQALGLDRRTVAKWLAEPRFRPRQCAPRASKLDPYKAQIRQWLEAHHYSAQQVFQRLREDGFKGSYTLVKDYVRTVRPRRLIGKRCSVTLIEVERLSGPTERRCRTTSALPQSEAE